jgi:hypothetical protein
LYNAVKYYLPHIILFCVFLAALLPVMYYYRRRHPHPRFRPGAGELTLLFVFAIAIGAPACYFLGNVFRGGVDTKKFTEKPDEGAGWSNGATTIHDPDKDEDGRKRNSKDKDD